MTNRNQQLIGLHCNGDVRNDVVMACELCTGRTTKTTSWRSSGENCQKKLNRRRIVSWVVWSWSLTRHPSTTSTLMIVDVVESISPILVPNGDKVWNRVVALVATCVINYCHKLVREGECSSGGMVLHQKCKKTFSFSLIFHCSCCWDIIGKWCQLCK